jgi:hypothetical protein
MDREGKLTARAEIIKPRLADDRLGFESIPYLLIGNFFVEAQAAQGRPARGGSPPSRVPAMIAPASIRRPLSSLGGSF